MKGAAFYFFFLTFYISLSCCTSQKAGAGKKIAKDNAGNMVKKGADGSKTSIFLDSLLAAYPQYFREILSKRDAMKRQVIYTRIDRDAKNKPTFTDYYFHVNPDDYFYPASTIKMPIAFLALQKLNELKIAGLDKNSILITKSNYSNQTEVYNDPTAADGKPSVAHYIKKIFLVSDNDAFNRLYEFLGQQYINERLHNMGYEDVQVRHRLSISLSDDENRHTNSVAFYDDSAKLLYDQPLQFSAINFAQRSDSIGEKYYNNDQLIPHAMDFSNKNRISLEDQHHILRSIIFPNSVPKKKRFALSQGDYGFLYQYMSQYPPETNYPPYDSASNWNAYSKFLFWGAGKGELPKNIRIFNKIGGAYGFLTDISYFVDFDKNIEFMLSATIYCNSDGILNDDKYDYDTVGYPFLKNLGRVIYDYEVKRARRHAPDLSAFRMKYDK
jgi:hypothetical protein